MIFKYSNQRDEWGFGGFRRLSDIDNPDVVPFCWFLSQNKLVPRFVSVAGGPFEVGILSSIRISDSEKWWTVFLTMDKSRYGIMDVGGDFMGSFVGALLPIVKLHRCFFFFLFLGRCWVYHVLECRLPKKERAALNEKQIVPPLIFNASIFCHDIRWFIETRSRFMKRSMGGIWISRAALWLCVPCLWRR